MERLPSRGCQESGQTIQERPSTFKSTTINSGTHTTHTHTQIEECKPEQMP